MKEKNLIYVWVDGACHPEFLESFGMTLEQIPGLIYYNDAKKM